jgi:ATP-binding cassette subfamily A (ABC1) protein 2
VGAGAKYGLSIIPPIAVALGANNVALFESSGIGLHKYNFNENYQNYSLAGCLWMMFISFWVFTFLGLYLDQVLPGVNGIRKPWYFPV